jgi:hypothetical protein
VANLDWRRNLLTWSEQFDNAAWVKGVNGTASAPVVTANATTAPDGTMTADLVQLRLNGATDGSFSWLYQNLVVPSGATRTTSIYVKAAIAGDVGKVVFLTGTVNTSFTLTADWQRVSNSALLVTGTTISFGVRLRGSDVTANSVDLHIWGAQADEGSVATTYQSITDVNAEARALFPNATLYQDTAGTTLVTTPGQPVGLMLDKSRGLALGPELVVNGTFDSGSTGWSPGSGWSISGGSANSAAASGFGDIRSTYNVTTIGRTYRLTFTANIVSGGVRWYLGGVTAPTTTTSSGTYSVLITATEVNYVAFISYGSGGAFTGTIDNVSVKELAGNHAVQATGANRPNYGIEPQGGRRNLLGNSAFTGAVVGTVGSGGALPTGWISTAFDTVQVVEIGTYEGVSAIRIKGTRNNTSGASVFPSIRPAAITTVSGVAYIGSAVSKLGPDNANLAAMPSLLIQTPSNSPSVSVPADWGIISSSSTATGTPSQMVFGCTVANGQVGVYDFWVSAPQFEVGTARTAYQRVTDQYNVTEAGVPPVSYLFFNGNNFSMSTPSINFPAGPTNPTLGAELVTSGIFAAPLTVSNGAGANQAIGTVVGVAYSVSYRVTAFSGSGSVRLSLGTTGLGLARTATGTYSEIILTPAGSSPSNVYAFISTSTSATIDNVSVRELDAAQAPDKMTVFAGVRKLSDAAVGIVIEHSANVGANNGSFYLASGPNGTAGWSSSSRGTTSPGALQTAEIAIAAPDTAVLSSAHDIANDLTTLRRNGVAGTSATGDKGAGTFGNYPLYLGHRFNNPPTTASSLFFSGHLYQLIVRGAQTSAETVTQTNIWVAGETGFFVPVISGVPTVGIS